MIGLKQGVVELADHNLEWAKMATDTIKQLWWIFGSKAKDIQHVGSTAIKNIKAKPIIDIAVAVDDFAVIEPLIPAIEKAGFIYRKDGQTEWQRYVVLNDLNGFRTHNIHIVLKDGADWKNYLLFRDLLNANPDIAHEYETVKLSLMDKFKYDRLAYVDGKTKCCMKVLQLAQIWSGFDRKLTIIKPIEKGLSDDRKFYIENIDGQHLFLRVSDIEECNRKKAEYSMMERVYNIGVITPQPIEFGMCDNGKSVYSLSSWLDGEDAETTLTGMSNSEQYGLGIKAAEVLQKIHTLPAPENVEAWGLRFIHKVRGRIDFYNTNPIKSKNADKIIGYLQDNQHLLDNRPQTFVHGDYNIENLIIVSNGHIGVLDFNYYNLDYGDPWWEFCSILWGTEPSAHFYTGFIKGYFNNEPPREFFEVLSYYLAYDALAALCDTSIGNQGEPGDGKRHMENILRWLDNMSNPVPTWYLKDFYVQWIDGVPYKLKEPFDFSFLNKYGKVFKVFDEQGSGNIAFGVQNGERRYFVKFAGAIDTTDAIERLKYATVLYLDLEHQSLIKFIKAEEIGSGYVAVFEWADALGIEPLNSPDYMKFMQMPIENKMQAFEDIVEFHIYVATKGYVALDFYDGSILYNYDKNKVVICDIDVYQKSPYVGDMGLMGSSRYVSPEECAKDAIMDEITNVYTMGATAFSLFAYGDRSIEAWQLNMDLYDVAKKAVNDERSERQQSIQQFINEWRAKKS